MTAQPAAAAVGVTYERCPSSDSLAWQRKGVCSRGTHDPELWSPRDFDESMTSKNRRHRKAKALCATCPVIRDCLEWALTVQERHGVWGGLTEPERMRLLGRARPSRGTSAAPRLQSV